MVAAATSGPPCPMYPAFLCFFLSLEQSSHPSPLSVLSISDGRWSAHLLLYRRCIVYLEHAPQGVWDTALHFGNPHRLLTMQTNQQPITHKLKHPVCRCPLPWKPLPCLCIDSVHPPPRVHGVWLSHLSFLPGYWPLIY